MSDTEKIQACFKLVDELKSFIKSELGKDYTVNLHLNLRKGLHNLDRRGHSWVISCTEHPWLTQFQCTNCKEYCEVQDGEQPNVSFLCEVKENV